MLRGLKRVQTLQGGGDREGPIMVLESEVSLLCLVLSFYSALIQEPTYEVSRDNAQIVPAGIMRGRGRLEGNALAAAGDFVGGRGSRAVVTSPNVGGRAIAPVTKGGSVGGPEEVKARMSVAGRGFNGAGGGSAVYAGSRFRRSVKERLGNVEQSDNTKAETTKVGG